MSYKEITGYYLSSDKESNIYYRICVPDCVPKAVIQIAHGMCEYFDRYEGFIEFFTEKGFIVCGNDHIGHGKSVQDNADLGFFGKGNYEFLSNDLKQLNSIIRKTYRSLPYILVGHSMGSFVVRDYITKYADTIDGTVICGTSGTNKAVNAGIALSSFIAKLKGGRYRSSLIRNIAFKGYNSHYSEENDANSWLTRDTQVREKYAKDVLCNYTFTVDGYVNMLSLLKKVSAQGWEEGVPKGLPVFIIGGEEDPVGDYGKGAAEVHERLSTAEINFLKFKLYPDARHELFNEYNCEEVMEDICSFIDDVIDGVLEARGYVR